MSVGGPSPAFPVVHTHGVRCGPENTGPSTGWFVIVRRAPAPPSKRATRSFAPAARPVTSPMYRPFGRTAKLDVMALPFSSTIRPDASAPSTMTSTSASLFEMRSARLDSTSIVTLAASARAGTMEIAARAARAAMRVRYLFMGPLPSDEGQPP